MIAAADTEWRLLVRFLAETGLRIGELIALAWSDVDLTACRVHVERRMLEGTIDLPKSHYGIRTVPLSRKMAADLAEYRTQTFYPADGDLVLPTKTGTHIHPSNLSHRVIKQACQLPGVGASNRCPPSMTRRRDVVTGIGRSADDDRMYRSGA